MDPSSASPWSEVKYGYFGLVLGMLYAPLDVDLLYVVVFYALPLYGGLLLAFGAHHQLPGVFGAPLLASSSRTLS